MELIVPPNTDPAVIQPPEGGGSANPPVQDAVVPTDGQPGQPVQPSQPGAGAAEPELSAKDKALLAWAETDPEGFDEYMKALEAKAPGAATEAKPGEVPPAAQPAAAVVPVLPAPDAAAPENADAIDEANFVFALNAAETQVNQANQAYAQRYNEWADVAGQLEQMRAAGDMTSPGYQYLAQRVQQLEQAARQQYAAGEQAAGQLEVMRQIEREATALGVKGAKAVYAELRLRGLITEGMTAQQRLAVLDTALTQTGRKAPKSAAPPPGSTARETALARLQRLKTAASKGAGAAAAKPAGKASAGTRNWSPEHQALLNRIKGE